MARTAPLTIEERLQQESDDEWRAGIGSEARGGSVLAGLARVGGGWVASFSLSAGGRGLALDRGPGAGPGPAELGKPSHGARPEIACVGPCTAVFDGQLHNRGQIEALLS